MDKININLLPKQISEKHKAERRFDFMLLGLIIIVSCMVAIYGYNYLAIMKEQSALESLKSETAAYQIEISRIENLEKDKLAVEEREKTVNSIMAVEYSWPKFLNNISLIVPNEVWLTGLSADKGGSLSFNCQAIEKSQGAVYKPVAKFLIHLGEVDDIYDVVIGSFSGNEVEQSSAASTTVQYNQISFSASAKIRTPGSSAPPTSGGQ